MENKEKNQKKLDAEAAALTEVKCAQEMNEGCDASLSDEDLDKVAGGLEVDFMR